MTPFKFFTTALTLVSITFSISNVEAKLHPRTKFSKIILKEGNGPSAREGDTLVVNYRMILTSNGKVIDSSFDRGQPFKFTLGDGQVIRGWDRGLAGIRKGEKRKIFIPYRMAYGSKGAGGMIPPYSDLISEVELVEIE
ncbi:MAG: FKBP-type peptidyl-prolyl cis-trans isomerase [Bdellovibrionales bacterium]|nr:FKBP-type peptidyl-prolyl cis-trans isomerase [Bdellovibrionales bacterium]